MPTQNNQVVFKFGLQSAYTALASKNDDTVYFCTDTRKVFVGDKAYADQPTYYGTCSTAADTPTKAVTLDTASSATYTLAAGAVLIVKFTYGSAIELAMSLKVANVSKSIRYGGTKTTSTGSLWSADSVCTFVYDGTYWNLIDPLPQWSLLGGVPPTFTPTAHTHGNITNAGAVTVTATIASGDKLIIQDSSASSVVKASSISFGTATTTFLRNDGTWATPAGGGGGGGTDENVAQALLPTTTAGSFPVLLKHTAGSTDETAGVNYASAITVAPSSGQVSATSFSGSGLQLTNLGRIIRFNCTTAAATAAKATQTSSIDGLTLTDTDLADGLVVEVYFRYPLAAASPTLKVSNCTAFPIGITGVQGDDVTYTRPPLGSWQFGQLVQFMFTTTHRSGSTLADKGVWMMTNPGYVIQVESSNSTEYPVLLRYANSTNYPSLTDGTRYCADVKIKPSTGALTANEFSGGTAHTLTLTKSSGTDGPNSTTLYYTQVGKHVTVQMDGFSRTAASQAVSYTYSGTLPTPIGNSSVFRCEDYATGSYAVSVLLDTGNKRITFPNGSTFDGTDAFVWSYIAQ